MLFQWSRLEVGSVRLVRFLPYNSPGNLYMALEHRARYWEEDVHYTALSYVHGDRSERRPITLAGRSFMITRGLHDALDAIWARGDRERWFWVDQLCINQQNLMEKNAQVAQMGAIYASADQVVAWLKSEEDLMTDQATKAGAESGAGSTTMAQKLDSSHYPKFDMSAIARHPYWRRAWTRVEALRARKLEVMYGQQTIAHQDLTSLYDSASEQYESFKTLLQRRYPPGADIKDDHLNACAILDQVLREYSGNSSSNALDRVFAMFSDPRLDRLPSTHRPRIDYGITPAELTSSLISWHGSLLQHDHSTENPEQASGQFSRLARGALDVDSK